MPWLRNYIKNLTIVLNCYREGSLSDFKLDCPALKYDTQRDLAHTLEQMSGLKEFRFEVTWHPNNTNAVLLPAQRQAILRQIRFVTVGDRGAWEKWQETCEVRDATRWKVVWSGVVSMRRKDGFVGMG